MKIIEDVEELIDSYTGDMWFDKETNTYSSSDYKHLYYDCGCGEPHVLRDTEYNLIARPVKFIFECSNGYMTAVRVKGILFQKSIELWSCKADLFWKAQKKMKEIVDMIDHG
tara:strand:+ start:165 stop:500 length:336 start_codon:yes stop_codon:yes gene_type:complete